MEDGTQERVRCIMCTTGMEERVARAIMYRELGEAIIPKKIRRRCFHGVWEEDQVPLLPGYVFVFDEGSCPESLTLLRMDHVIRVLRYTDEPQGWLRGADLSFACWLRDQRGLFGTLEAVREGSFVRITDGILRDFNGTVLTVDKRKQLAKVQLDILDGQKIVWLNYSFLEEEN